MPGSLRAFWRARVVLLVLLLPFVVQARCGSTSRTGVQVVPEVVTTSQSARAYVSTTAAQVDLSIFDVVRNVTVFQRTVNGQRQATSSPAHLGSGWTRFESLPTLSPGLYQVRIPSGVVGDADRFHPQGIVGFAAPLLVRPVTPGSVGKVLLVYDSGTVDAYNEWGGGSSYYSSPPVVKVSRARPGSKRNVHAEIALLARELESLGHGWEVADVDYVEDHPGVLSSYRLVVLVNKFEYITRPFRVELQRYFDSGGRILAIGVEYAVFQSRRVGNYRTCYKYTYRGTDPVLTDGNPSNDHLASYEWATVGEPSTTLFGTSYWLGGAPGVATAWKAHRTGHWLWAGTGLSEGGAVGDLTASQLIDGTLLSFSGGLPYTDRRGQTRTPADFLVLASVPTVNARPWWCWLGGTPKAQCSEPGWGTIGIRQQGAGVLLVIPDFRWLRSDVWSQHPKVRRATRNALQTLAAPGPVNAHDGYTP